MMSYDFTETARRQAILYWGPGPLPVGASIAGLVTRETGETGALIRIGARFAQGNAGSIRSLPPMSEVPA